MKGFDGLVLIPGLMCDSRLFEPQISALGNKVAIEVADISGASSIEELARSVLDAIAFSRFALAGLSMGGIVAMEMLRQKPERIERLALLDTNHLCDDEERKRSRREQLDRVRQGRLRAVMQDLKPFYVAPRHRDDPVLNAIFMAMALDLGADVFARQTTALLQRGDAIEPLRAYRGKTLILCGEHDLPCPPSRHREIAELLENAELEIVSGAGHVSTLEAPAAVNAAMLKWLEA